ncbi:MAG: hypothetical protein VYE40_09135 [Myxococcota bacterium]|nr:hypothetical protein [Myxococcota bacterium]
MQIPASILGESRGAQAQTNRTSDELAGERAHGDKFARYLDPKSRGEEEQEEVSSRRSKEDRVERDVAAPEEGASRDDLEQSTQTTNDDEQRAKHHGLERALHARSSDAFEQIVADLRVKNAREKLLLTPKKATRVHKNLSSAHVARLSLLVGQGGGQAKHSAPRSAPLAVSGERRQTFGAVEVRERAQSAKSEGRSPADEPDDHASAKQTYTHSEHEGAASETTSTSHSPRGESPVLERIASPREALDTIVSRLHRADQLPVREAASSPIITRQMLPASPARGMARMTDLAQARGQLVRMKATQTGGVLELDIGVEHTQKATLRLEVEDGKARAICRCHAPEGVVEAQKMVDSLRDVLARAGMELGEVDVRFEGESGQRDGSRQDGASSRDGEGAKSNAAGVRILAEDDGLEVIVSGLIHVIG